MMQLNTSSQPTKMVTAIPAISGIMMASRPATIIRTLRKIDHPRVFFTRVEAVVAVALMTVPPKFRQRSFETNAKQSACLTALFLLAAFIRDHNKYGGTLIKNTQQGLALGFRRQL